MNKKLFGWISVLIIIAFIGYIVYDSVRTGPPAKETSGLALSPVPEDAWKISHELQVESGILKAVAVSSSGKIYAGGDSFVTCFNKDLNMEWNLKTPAPVTALACSGDSIFATTIDQVLVIDNGKLLNEWGPYEKNSIITSVSANRNAIGFADAGNRVVFILDRGGEVKTMIGHNDSQFVLPSAYFDIVLSGNTFYVANTGHRRIEKRNLDGKMTSWFGEAGLAPDAFCGCCNPAHFTVIPDGFITAEKGINRIKILDSEGKFSEFVSSVNNFVPSIPLDVASIDGKTIFAANPADSKLYVYTRK